MKDTLKILGWTSAEFAKRTGTHVTTVSRWIHGRIPIPKWVHAYLQMALNVKVLSETISPR
jgi:transcriptional regulator with XRE-family HTH domain